MGIPSSVSRSSRTARGSATSGVSRVLRRVLAFLPVVALAASFVVGSPAAVSPSFAQDANPNLTQPHSQTQAQAHPQAQAGPPSADASVWENPLARSTDPVSGVSMRILDVHPRFVDFDAATAPSSSATTPPSQQSPSQQYTLRIRNNSKKHADQLRLAVKSAQPHGSSAEVRVSQLSNSGEYPQSTPQVFLPDRRGSDPTADEAISLAPGQSRDVQVTLRFGDPTVFQDATPRNSDSSDTTIDLPLITHPGTYPIMFTLSASMSASQSDAGGPPEATGPELVAVARASVTGMASEKKKEETANRDGDTPNGAPQGAPLTFIWPLGADSNSLPGATGDAPQHPPLFLRNESLATALSAGGHLREMIDAYSEAVAGPQGEHMRAASCIAIDPALLEVVERMTHGYRVGDQLPPQAEKNKRLRDSWGDLLRKKDTSHPGMGVEAAKDWLSDLRKLVDNGCTIALPNAGADINTIARSADESGGAGGAGGSSRSSRSSGAGGGSSVGVGSDGSSGGAANNLDATGWLSVHALGRGPSVINRILGVWPTQNVVLPPSGVVAPDAVPFLAAGATQGITGDLSRRFEAMFSGMSALPSPDSFRDVTALVSENSVNVESGAEAPGEAGTTGETGAPGETSEPGASGTPGQPDPNSDKQWNDRLVNITNGAAGAPQSSERPKFRALTFSGDLGTVLAAAGSRPQVTRYSDPDSRFDLAADSDAARMSTVLAVLRQEFTRGRPVLAVPPGDWSLSAQDARAYLRFIESAFVRGDATPATLGDALAPRGIGVEQLASGKMQVPFRDPGEPPNWLPMQAADVARRTLELTVMMKNSPHIALRREQFTRPLVTDSLRATSAYGVRVRSLAGSSRVAAQDRLYSAALTTEELRTSVRLLPPGNVFTRTSNSAPLIVVAQNGLPLPVPVKVRYQDASVSADPWDSKVHSIPAKGSLTVPLRTDAKRSDLLLWLTMPNNFQISDTVKVSVQEGPQVGRTGLLVALGVVVLGAVAGKILLSRSRRRTRMTHLHKNRQAEPPAE